MSPYNLFLKEKSSETKEYVTGIFGIKAQKWKIMSEAEKEPYIRKHEKLMLEYEKSISRRITKNYIYINKAKKSLFYN